MYRITILPQQQKIQVPAGIDLLSALRGAGLAPDAPCGGNGSCGKCKVLADGKEVLACKTTIDRDMTVTLPAQNPPAAKPADMIFDPLCTGEGLLAFDIGTTTVAGYLLDAQTGEELACESTQNPQTVFGADVISRIRYAQKGALTDRIRKCIWDMTCSLCQRAGIPPEKIRRVSIVGNPAMQQLFLGISPDNLAQIPFAPVLTQAKTISAAPYLPGCKQAQLLIVPDISGFVGADTVACLLATKLDSLEELTLLVDIGTNGEMVLGNRQHMVACATAAGPALEGASIRFGMRGQTGAIDHVRLEDGRFHCSVIGGGEAMGICGTGLVDAIAAALDGGLINQRGKLLTEDGILRLTDTVYLTQEDIRQVQLAKGAIAAGIRLMTAYLGVTPEDIKNICLAGAFGTCIDPRSAFRIGLLPAMPGATVQAVGNAAGSGAKCLASQKEALSHSQKLVSQIPCLELASLPEFPRCFAENMRFTDNVTYWCRNALVLGFTNAVPLDVATLCPRQDVRDMCRADTCRAYGKNWTCPPHCGSLEQCETKIRSYTQGLLLQTVGRTEKAIDTKAYRRTEERHLNAFYHLTRLVRQAFPQALCLGSGGCRICERCAYPEPCRFPEQACPSMEGYGLFVTQVCRDNGLKYHHGEKTVTYTACILLP